MSTTTAPAPVDGVCRRLRVTRSAAPAGVTAAVVEAVRRQGTVEVEAAGAEALQHAIEGIAAARVALTHDGREIAVAPSLVGDARGREPTLRLRVLRAALSAGQLHELLRAQLEELVGGDPSSLDAVADRLTAAVLVGTSEHGTGRGGW
jgi:stage V sporulation protein SpoVS